MNKDIWFNYLKVFVATEKKPCWLVVLKGFKGMGLKNAISSKLSFNVISFELKQWWSLFWSLSIKQREDKQNLEILYLKILVYNK